MRDSRFYWIFLPLFLSFVSERVKFLLTLEGREIAKEEKEAIRYSTIRAIDRSERAKYLIACGLRDTSMIAGRIVEKIPVKRSPSALISRARSVLKDEFGKGQAEEIVSESLLLTTTNLGKSLGVSKLRSLIHKARKKFDPLLGYIDEKRLYSFFDKAVGSLGFEPEESIQKEIRKLRLVKVQNKSKDIVKRTSNKVLGKPISLKQYSQGLSDRGVDSLTAERSLFHFRLGLEAIRRRKFPRAIGMLSQCLRIVPNESLALHNMGVAYSGMGDYLRAMDCCEEAVKISPRLQQPWLTLSVIYSMIEYSPNPIYREVWIRKYRKRGIEASEVSAKLDPKNHLPWIFMGKCYLDLGETEKAVGSYQESLKLHPEYPQAWLGLGNLYCSIGKFEEAIRCSKRAIGIDGSLANAWNCLGVSYLQEGKSENATRSLKRAISLQPRFAEGWYNLGNAYSVQGDKSKAEACLSRAKELRFEVPEQS